MHCPTNAQIALYCLQFRSVAVISTLFMMLHEKFSNSLDQKTTVDIAEGQTNMSSNINDDDDDNSWQQIYQTTENIFSPAVYKGAAFWQVAKKRGARQGQGDKQRQHALSTFRFGNTHTDRATHEASLHMKFRHTHEWIIRQAKAKVEAKAV